MSTYTTSYRTVHYSGILLCNVSYDLGTSFHGKLDMYTISRRGHGDVQWKLLTATDDVKYATSPGLKLDASRLCYKLCRLNAAILMYPDLLYRIVK